MFTQFRKLMLTMFLLVVTILALSACSGVAASTSGQPVEVQIKLTEFKFEPSQTTFTTGVPYRFVLKNVGTVTHDWEIMPRGEMDTTKALIMVKENELPPGATVTRDFTFTKPGDLEFACHAPGHYEAGMKLPIEVK